MSIYGVLHDHPDLLNLGRLGQVLVVLLPLTVLGGLSGYFASLQNLTGLCIAFCCTAGGCFSFYRAFIRPLTKEFQACPDIREMLQGTSRSYQGMNTDESHRRNPTGVLAAMRRRNILAQNLLVLTGLSGDAPLLGASGGLNFNVQR